MQQEFDRRAQERMAVNTETKCSFVSPVLEDFGPGRIHNISMDGLALLLTSRVQPGTLMAVMILTAAWLAARTPRGAAGGGLEPILNQSFADSDVTSITERLRARNKNRPPSRA